MLIDLPNTGESLSPIGCPLPRGTTRHIISGGATGTAQTIAMMQKLVNAGKRNNEIRVLCGQILNPKNGPKAESKNYFQYADWLYRWVRSNILYAYDPANVEYIEAPEKILRNRIADCDSMDILLCSMFEHVGLTSQFVTIKADASRPEEFTHVFTRVLIPKMGWVCADPIMPDKWFGWEPPFPNGKRYWAATSDALKQPLDTSESIPFPTPGQPSAMPDFGDGMSGLGSLGRGGRHHHGGRGRGNWGGGGWGGPGYWGAADGDINIINVIPLPDQLTIVPTEDTDVQAMENPMMEQSSGMNGIIGDVWNTARGLVSKPPDITQAIANAILGKIADGSEAKRLNAERQKIYAYVDSATKALKQANALPDGPTKSRAISAAKALRSAAYEQQYALNDVMGSYNVLAAFINNLPYAGNVIPSLNGFQGWPAVGVGVVVVGAAVLWQIHDYQENIKEMNRRAAIVAQAATDQALISLAKTDPKTAIELARARSGQGIPSASAPPASDPGSPVTLASRLLDCVTNPGVCLSPIINYAIAGGVLYLAYKALSFGVGVKAESYKVRAIRKAEAIA